MVIMNVVLEEEVKCLSNAFKSKSGMTERDGAELMRHVFGDQAIGSRPNLSPVKNREGRFQ